MTYHDQRPTPEDCELCKQPIMEGEETYLPNRHALCNEKLNDYQNDAEDTLSDALRRNEVI